MTAPSTTAERRQTSLATRMGPWASQIGIVTAFFLLWIAFVVLAPRTFLDTPIYLSFYDQAQSAETGQTVPDTGSTLGLLALSSLVLFGASGFRPAGPGSWPGETFPSRNSLRSMSRSLSSVAGTSPCNAP